MTHRLPGALAALLFAALALTAVLAAPAFARETTTLTTADGLTVTADVYRAETDAASAPWIVLAHQAGSSRGEYREIAPRLARLGYNAVALDQRSGKTFAGVPNQTAALSRKRGKGTSYLSAIPDIEAGLAFAKAQNDAPVILWGSSYSAALSIYLAGQTPDLADAVVAMSPGEYLRGRSVTRSARNIQVPVLIVSPPGERRNWTGILAAIPDPRKRGFAPKAGGRHGSSALIAARSQNPEEHWTVVEGFLAEALKR